MDVGQRIKRLRMRRHMTQQELADKVGFKNKSAIAKIESGNRETPEERLELIAEALDTTLDYLVYGKDGYNKELGDYQDNKDHVTAIDPSLLPYLEELSDPNKRILFDKIKELEPQDVVSLLRVVKMIEEGK
ncbi:helix-turn-helix domain-containing protein [Faecalibaculum rodentium]|uniref:helix-turn-helix domain-containing protein n=1 Tax=Faecalibaculum rodentium TaxID=1702221 RepID=UPI0022C7A5EB|nr:helix-turn-helix domain-containing protein [Faecalibaculum rodentium]MCZ2807915.1 helix-turn-helix domain-containing protein [Candidatus Bathyarchaeota archaeon]